MTSDLGPASADDVILPLRCIFFTCSVQAEAPPPLLLLLTHLDPFWSGCVCSLFLETYLYICISDSC